MLKKRYHIAIAAGVLALALTGCSAGGGASTQSKEDACALVQKSFTDFAEISSDTDFTDPQGAVDKVKELADKASESLNEVTNADVKPAATKAVAALSDYAEFLQSVISDPTKAAGMTDQITALQEGFTTVGTLCGE